MSKFKCRKKVKCRMTKVDWRSISQVFRALTFGFHSTFAFRHSSLKLRFARGHRRTGPRHPKLLVAAAEHRGVGFYERPRTNRVLGFAPKVEPRYRPQNVSI